MKKMTKAQRELKAALEEFALREMKPGGKRRGPLKPVDVPVYRVVRREVD